MEHSGNAALVSVRLLGPARSGFPYVHCKGEADPVIPYRYGGVHPAAPALTARVLPFLPVLLPGVPDGILPYSEPPGFPHLLPGRSGYASLHKAVTSLRICHTGYSGRHF